jgi:hypothetical protein
LTTTYFLNLIAGNVFKSKTSPGIPTAYYIALSTTTPTVAGGSITEPSGGAYARVNITSLISQPSGGEVSNTSVVSFPESTAAWGTVTYYVIFDAATGGNALCYGALSASVTVVANTTISFKTGEIKLTVRNP